MNKKTIYGVNECTNDTIYGVNECTNDTTLSHKCTNMRICYNDIKCTKKRSLDWYWMYVSIKEHFRLRVKWPIRE